MQQQQRIEDRDRTMAMALEIIHALVCQSQTDHRKPPGSSPEPEPGKKLFVLRRSA